MAVDNHERSQELINRYEEVLFMVGKKVISLIKARIGDDLTMDQHLVMRYIQNIGPATSSQLAEAFFVKKSAITAIMNRLVDKGYIERLPDEQDRRVIYLTLTAEGRAVFAKSEQDIQATVEKYLFQLDEDEIEAFLQTYEKLARILKEEDAH